MNRDDFPILQQTIYGKPLIYLDNAATTQKPTEVIEAITYAYTHFNANIHRGVHHLSQVATQAHEQARAKVAEWLHADNPNCIIFTKGATDSLNMLAFSFGEAYIHEGDEIIIGMQEHHSNIVPWQMLCQRKKAKLRIIPLRDDLSLDIEAYKHLFNTHTQLVSIAHVSNVLGIVNPIEQMIAIAHANHVPICIDAAQSAPHMPINVQALDCDFLALSAHKAYGPTGLGILYGKENLLAELPPAQGGGEMIQHVSFQKTTFNTLPYKFEAGTPNYIGSYAFMKAIEYMQRIGMEHIHAYETDLTRYAEQQMSQIEGIHIYAKGLPKQGVISFNVNNIHPYDLGMLLDKQGIAVRTGHHCAEPLIDYLHIPGTVRMSVALYNTREDIDQFILALHKAIAILT